MTPNRSVPAHIVFAGGGTGGHLFPGKAVAEQLRLMAPGTRITFAGTEKPFERQQVAAAGYEHLAIACRPLPRRISQAFGFIAGNFKGYRAAIAFLNSHHISAVVGLGGYASVPMARAAVARGIPLVLLEQNAAPGRATRHLAPHASLICAAFEQVRSQLQATGPLRVTGTPVRGPSCEATPKKSGAERLLLILGGSQGARSLNQAVPRALHSLRSNLAGWKILHQTGDLDLEVTTATYRELGVQATAMPFIQHLPRLLPDVDLVVSRAGGTTLAELAANGVPAVLTPYPHASDDHQLRNAQAFAESGACRIVDERLSDGHLHEQIASALRELLIDESQRAAMSVSMRRLARIDAAWHVARMTLELASSQRRIAA